MIGLINKNLIRPGAPAIVLLVGAAFLPYVPFKSFFYKCTVEWLNVGER